MQIKDERLGCSASRTTAHPVDNGVLPNWCIWTQAKPIQIIMANWHQANYYSLVDKVLYLINKYSIFKTCLNYLFMTLTSREQAVMV